MNSTAIYTQIEKQLVIFGGQSPPYGEFVYIK